MPADGRNPAQMDARDAKILAALATAFVLSRLLWLLWNPGSATYWEEAYRWVAANELLTEPTQSLLGYQADHYQGGSLVMIFLILPVFRILGESAVALKLPALLVSTGVLSALFLVARRHFGRPVGILAALAYLTGPPLVAYWGLVVMGSHHESNLFSLILFALLLRMLSASERTLGSWGLFGLVAGLGAWFCYTATLSLAACGITWLLLERLPRPKEILCAAGGFLAGFFPWVVYNITFGFPGLVRIQELFGLREPVDHWVNQTLLEKLGQFLSYDLPVGLVLPVAGTFTPSVGAALCIAFYAPVVVALALSVGRAAGLFRKGLPTPGVPADQEQLLRRKELVFVVYGAVFLAVFLFSSFTVEHSSGIVTYRLFLAPAVLLLIPAAISAVRAFESGRWRRRLALAACGLTLASSTTATIGLASAELEQDRALTTSMGYGVMGLLAHRKYETDLGRACAVANRVPHPALRYKVKQGIGWGIEYRYEKHGDLSAIQELLEGLSVEDRGAFLTGMLWTSTVRRNQVRALVRAGDPEGNQRRLLERIRDLERFSRNSWKAMLEAGGEIPEWEEEDP